MRQGNTQVEVGRSGVERGRGAYFVVNKVGTVWSFFVISASFFLFIYLWMGGEGSGKL